MAREDWTNREASGAGYILNAFAILVALVFPTLGGYVVAAVLALIGIALILDGQLRRRRTRRNEVRREEMAAAAEDAAFFARIRAAGDQRRAELAPPAPPFKLRAEPYVAPLFDAYPKDLPGCLSSARELRVTFVGV